MSLRHRRSHAAALALSLVFSLFLAWQRAVGASQVAVADELQRLAAANGFEVSGLRHTTETMGRVDTDELYPRLLELLGKFNSVIVQGPAGKIERVIVLGPKVPVEAPPVTAESAPVQGKDGDIVVHTIRQGTAHAVQVSLEGESGQRISRTLVVDTGADFVVLPASLLAQLGLPAGAMKQRQMQTANGKVSARIGTLPGLWLGDARIPGVQAAFLDDAKLGENALLGMSVIGRYRMTMDDQHGLLTLAPK
jgi:clan AA aspartic protease (TIGR02281 family)